MLEQYLSESFLHLKAEQSRLVGVVRTKIIPNQLKSLLGHEYAQIG